MTGTLEQLTELNDSGLRTDSRSSIARSTTWLMPWPFLPCRISGKRNCLLIMRQCLIRLLPVFGCKAVPVSLRNDFNQYFIRIRRFAFDHMNSLDSTGNRRGDFGFHFHGLSDQNRLPGVNFLADFDQYVENIAWHADDDIAFSRRTTA